jgi:hypothetical protein
MGWRAGREEGGKTRFRTARPPKPRGEGRAPRLAAARLGRPLGRLRAREWGRRGKRKNRGGVSPGATA